MVKTKIVYRPIVVTEVRQRALKDRDCDTVADTALQEAVRADAEKFGKSEGYVLKVIQAERVKEESK